MRHIAKSDWDVFVSPEYDTEYYHNRRTGETSWTCPPEVVASLGMPMKTNVGSGEIAVAMNTINPMQPAASVSASQITFKMYHGPSGHPYYANTTTGEVSWVLPENGIVVDA